MNFEKIVELKFGVLHIKLSGFFNEFTDLGKHEFEKINSLLIDFTNIELINSRGIMVWIRFFHDARHRNPALNIVFMGCPKVLVDQFNLISTLLPKNTKIKSFAVPTVCEKCGAIGSVMIYEGKDYTYNDSAKTYEFKLPTIKCSNCSEPMIPDILEKIYFRFLNKAN